jgi:hypothetical protein
MVDEVVESIVVKKKQSLTTQMVDQENVLMMRNQYQILMVMCFKICYVSVVTDMVMVVHSVLNGQKTEVLDR